MQGMNQDTAGLGPRRRTWSDVLCGICGHRETELASLAEVAGKIVSGLMTSR